MIKMYGYELCPDCVEANQKLQEAGIQFEYNCFTDSTQNMKDFLQLRDTHSCFDEVRQEQGIGIPCFVLEDGSVTLDINEVLK